MIQAPRIWTALAMLLVPVPVVAAAQSAVPPIPAVNSDAMHGRGGMTLQEFEAQRARRLLAADTDGDRRISRAEFVAAPTTGQADRAKRFAKLDRDGDGVVDQGEVDAMLARRFRRLDRNGDGVLTSQERAALKSEAKVGQVTPQR